MNRIKAGRKTKQWNNVRRTLKVEFERMGITRCEICGSSFGLSFGHSKKRRHIVGDEIREVILICVNPCHMKLEAMPEREMHRIVNDIISRRETA